VAVVGADAGAGSGGGADPGNGADDTSVARRCAMAHGLTANAAFSWTGLTAFFMTGSRRRRRREARN